MTMLLIGVIFITTDNLNPRIFAVTSVWIVHITTGGRVNDDRISIFG